MRLSALAIATIAFMSIPGLAHAAKAPAAVQKEFDGFIAKFRAAVKADDRAAVVAITKLPFQDDASIATADQFYKEIYAQDFTKKNRACIVKTKAVYDRDEEGHDNYYITCYELIFTFTKTPAGFLFTDISVND